MFMEELDTPMDYATFVLLAEHIRCFAILTLDRRGFSTYRPSENRGFRLVPKPTQ